MPDTAPPGTPVPPADLPNSHARLVPACTLYCGPVPVRIFNVDGRTYLLSNDVMRATGNLTPRASVDHAASEFAELKAEGAVILRSVKGVLGKPTRLMTVDAAKAMIARSRSRHAVEVQRWLDTTFGTVEVQSPGSPDGNVKLAPAIAPSNYVRMEMTVTIEKARRILDIVGS